MIIPTLLGVEGITAKEVRRLGYETSKVEDGRVTFRGDMESICKTNLRIRTGERILIKVGEFKAANFDSLFDCCAALPWDEWLPKNASFPVKGFSNNSSLHSIPDCQSIIKKSIVTSLSRKYGISQFSEDGPLYRVQFSIMKDVVTLMIDTSGNPLHKRGYREDSNKAPLRETIAAAMVILTNWHYKSGEILADPFCGSGTIPIEAAMIAQNIAPGLNREFTAENFVQIPKKMWWDERKMAYDAINKSPFSDAAGIIASDTDSRAIRLSKKNSGIAGVRDMIKFIECPVKNYSENSDKNILKNFEKGIIICNPPYGERLGEKEDAEKIYSEIGDVYRHLENWNAYVISSHEEFEKHFGMKASKNRKLYNGMIKCYLYQYLNR